jgi:hypothetical protein
VHYNRWITHGSTDPVGLRIVGDDEARFMSKVDKVGDCWIWTGTTPRGYGQFSVNRRMKPAHRAAHELFVGPIPHQYEIDHLCRNISCVRPAHLEAVTKTENRRRQAAAAVAARQSQRCGVDACQRPVRCRGLCERHYYQHLRRPPKKTA